MMTEIVGVFFNHFNHTRSSVRSVSLLYTVHTYSDEYTYRLIVASPRFHHTMLAGFSIVFFMHFFNPTHYNFEVVEGIIPSGTFEAYILILVRYKSRAPCKRLNCKTLFVLRDLSVCFVVNEGQVTVRRIHIPTNNGVSNNMFYKCLSHYPRARSTRRLRKMKM